uniref:Uncharacterized protein n=1 Tax=Meloidogyne incognita TaxID=6306 RepID=A0A914KYM2_MELIC
MTILMIEAGYPVRRLANTVIFKYARIVVVHMAISPGLMSIHTGNQITHLMIEAGYPVRRLANTVIFKYARIVVVHMAISPGLMSIHTG